jgi:hypothetical protein
MNVFTEFDAIVRRLRADDVEYALIGGVALAFYANPRFTQDIDLLVPEHALERVQKILQDLGYFESAIPWTFASTQLTLHRFLRVEGVDPMLVDVLVAGSARHLEIVANAVEARDDRGGVVRVATRDDLVWLKRFRGSKQDLADIERLRDEEA